MWSLLFAILEGLRTVSIGNESTTYLNQFKSYSMRKLGQFAIPESCTNWLGLVDSCVLMPTRLVKFTRYSLISGKLWNPLSKRVLSKCSFVWNKGPVNIWKHRKLISNLYVGPVNIFSNFWHWDCIYTKPWASTYILLHCGDMWDLTSNTKQSSLVLEMIFKNTVWNLFLE